MKRISDGAAVDAETSRRIDERAERITAEIRRSRGVISSQTGGGYYDCDLAGQAVPVIREASPRCSVPAPGHCSWIDGPGRSCPQPRTAHPAWGRQLFPARSGAARQPKRSARPRIDLAPIGCFQRPRVPVRTGLRTIRGWDRQDFPDPGSRILGRGTSEGKGWGKAGRDLLAKVLDLSV